MRGSIRYAINVLATGVVVLVFFAIPTFFGRVACELGLVAAMPQEGRHVRISPTSLLPPLENEPTEPNETYHLSQTDAYLDAEALLEAFGIYDYMLSRMPGGCRSDVFARQDESWLYFDRPAGQVVFHDVQHTTVDGYPRAVSKHYRAGPEGITEGSGKDLGRFSSPIVKHQYLFRGGAPLTILYDPSLRRFFALDWRSQAVRSGPPLDASYHFPGFGERRAMSVDWRPSMYRVQVKREDPNDAKAGYIWRFTQRVVRGDGGRYVAIVRDSGRIDLLDQQTMEILQGKGSLPTPQTLFGQGVPRPSQLLGYDVELVYAYREGPADNEYIGMAVGAASRQGTSLALEEFHASGTPLGGRVHTSMRSYRAVMVGVQGGPPTGSAKAVISQTPWGPLLTAGKYVFETFHPPVLTLASYFAVDHIDARAGYRALFLAPNCFTAMQRDRVKESVAAQLGWALWFMVPALLLSAFLTWRVGRDAYTVGLSSNARLLWAIGTLSFGLPAYITYRLTRPAEGLVTCSNCGHTRRADAERCHRCGSPWLVPELVPPVWRVIGEPEEQPCDSTPAQPEETKPAAESQG